jgi:chromosome partitioning protein
MKILACYSNKGGVGKTATAVNLAYLSALNGLRTLLCDLDPQGASGFYFRIKPAKKAPGVAAFAECERIAMAIRASDYSNLDVLPASADYRDFDIFLSRLKNKRSRLKKLLRATAGDYQVAILDCPPNVSLLSENVFKAADKVVVPVIPTTLSVRTLEQLHDFFRQSGYQDKKLLPFFSMVQNGKNLHRDTMVRLQKEYKRLLQSYIPFSAEVEKMGIHRAPLMTFAGKDQASASYQALWNEVELRINIQDRQR